MSDTIDACNECLEACNVRGEKERALSDLLTDAMDNGDLDEMQAALDAVDQVRL
jgi:hypothetical protein